MLSGIVCILPDEVNLVPFSSNSMSAAGREGGVGHGTTATLPSRATMSVTVLAASNVPRAVAQ